MEFLLYGANGYTGQLITRFASDYKLKPVLAGRSLSKIEPLARQYNLDYLVFDLEDPGKVDQMLKDFPLVLHCAGPFQFTAKPMMEACLRTNTHYLDITGEIEVFELAHTYDRQAKEKGVMIMPGVGFDVVPTDCLALYLKNQLPDATHLKLAFASLGGNVSHGTANTMAESLGRAGAVRKDGKIIEVPLGHKTMRVPFSKGEMFVMTIPWGDVSTAYYSTGIPNIETYTGVPPATYKLLRFQKYYNALLRTSLVRNMAKRYIASRPAGPADEEREKALSVVWGEVKNASGLSKQARLSTPEGYTLTTHSSLIIAQKVLNGLAPAGHQTPAKAYGENLIMELDRVIREDL